MDVDQAVMAEPEGPPTEMEIGEVPRVEEADTSTAPAPAVPTPPTSTSNAARENVLSTATAPILHLHSSSSTPSAPSKPAAPPFGRTVVERSTLAPAAANSTQNTLFISPPSSTGGFPQRSQAPVQPGAGLNTSGRQSQPGNHSKSSNNQPTAASSQAPAGSSVSSRAGPPVNPSAGSPSLFSVGSGPGILPRPSVGPIPPLARSGSGSAGPASHPARPAGPVANRFPLTTNPVANSGEPAPPGQGGHIDISNRKVVLQGVPQTP
jgi:hypothetical protein